MNIKSIIFGSIAALAAMCATSYAATPGEGAGAPADIVYGASTDPFPGNHLAMKPTPPSDLVYGAITDTILGPQLAINETLLGPQVAVNETLTDPQLAELPDETLIIKGDDIIITATPAICTDPGPKMDKLANLNGGPKAEKHPVLPWRFAEASGRHGKKPNLLVPAGGNKATEWDETLI